MNNLIDWFRNTEIIASFSGALLFVMIENSYYGISKLFIFIISFIMGIFGADATESLLSLYFPEATGPGKELSAFFCGVFIVTISRRILSKIKN